MIILVNSKVTASSIQSSLGKPEYSYYFLLKLYRPALEQVGQIIEVGSIAEVDPLFEQYRAAGEQVIFLSISPPQQTPTHLQCPTVCLFAWEFPNVPNQAFDNDPKNDWQYVFARIAGAIACSQESAQAVRNLMGDDYPVIALPAPVWAHFQHLCPAQGWLPLQPNRSFEFSGNVVDSADYQFSANGLVQHWPRPEPFIPTAKKASKKPNAFSITQTLFKEWLVAVSRHPLPAAIAKQYQQAITSTVTTVQKSAQKVMLQAARIKNVVRNPRKLIHKIQARLNRTHGPVVIAENIDAGPRRIDLTGVVFSSIFNPIDGRKNWDMLITAFCWAFRDEPNATLVLKMTHHDVESFRIPLLTILSRLSPFQCRVIALHGYLNDSQYQSLISMTDFYVNASSSEGLCLPLIEFAAAGKPVIAPIHTAMLDYIQSNFAQIVDSSLEPCNFYQDPSGCHQSLRHRIHWQSLMEGYRQCYNLALQNPKRYQEQSLQAFTALKNYSDLPAVVAPLTAFLNSLPATYATRGNV